jgi:hypothetical protein
MRTRHLVPRVMPRGGRHFRCAALDVHD